MAQEIERKFLLRSNEWRRLASQGRLIQQGYLASHGKVMVRVRSFDDEHAVITIKGKRRGISRSEFEYPIPIDDARELLALAQSQGLVKRRFNVPYGGLTWEVDVFEGRHQGLIIAEVELASADQEIDLPSWVGEEVSQDDRYYNAALARDS